MEKLVLFILLMLPVAVFSQSPNKEETKSDLLSLTEEQKDSLFLLTEEYMINGIDSVMNEGRFMQALELINYIQVNWKNITEQELSPRMYLKKGVILQYLEEWRDLVKTTEECLSIHKGDISDKIAAIMYGMQGNAHRNLEEYQKAIRSYEEGLYFYAETGDLGSQGDMLCSMALCYGKLGKHTMASSFYEKGINKFLEYFDISRSALLRSNFSVKDDPYKQTVLGVFAAHLFSLAVYEQNYGSNLNSMDYLLMAAHCGISTAKSEYDRIFGYR